MSKAEPAVHVDAGCSMSATKSSSIKLSEFADKEGLRIMVQHLYELLDDIDTADDMAKDNDAVYRKLVQGIQAKKNALGVCSPDGYELCVVKP